MLTALMTVYRIVQVYGVALLLKINAVYAAVITVPVQIAMVK
jgi:hypothetical protein